ncbi:hypothetical protein SAMN05421857_3523 [Chryseobacterium formosense]|uniref:hypothetical protein n=1 Tax=Chryseobacterium formosense TaxID=236814 RepID=UPI0008DFBC26|nr:hypothetical protein [Chryseobacterium formosense]SFT83081.1 hypothetical protein SAMN05421857_3523 [Chryseobacterium formosense]
MKKCYFIMLFFMLGYSINAQVGINTDNPKSTLHVQKRTELSFADGIIPPRISGDSLRLKEGAYAAAQNGAIVYVTSPAVTTGPKTVGVNSTGLFIYDANASNGTGTGLWNKLPTTTTPTGTGDGAYAARINSGLSLLQVGLNLLNNTVQIIPLPTASVNTPTTTPVVDINLDVAGIANISTTIGTGPTSPGDSYYTVPSTGLYHINYSYRTGQGLRLEVLGANRPGLIITKSPAGGLPVAATPIDYRYFGGISLGNLTIPLQPLLPNVTLSLGNLALTQGQINHIYQFNAGERIRFGVLTGGLALGVLTDASAELSIYKIR